jgi:predicted Zn-dependent peptidase
MIKKKTHTIYGILYHDNFKQCTVASVAADSSDEALNLLEKILEKRKQTINKDLDYEIIPTKNTTLSKGLYRKYDTSWLFPYLLGGV